MNRKVESMKRQNEFSFRNDLRSNSSTTSNSTTKNSTASHEHLKSHPGTDDDKEKIVIEQFYRSIAPLITTLCIFGLYFEPSPKPATKPNRIHPHNGDPKNANPSSQNQIIYYARGRFGRVYALTVLIVLWANIVRMLSTFTSSDKLSPELLSTLLQYLWMLTCACNHTAFFLACRSGRLPAVLDELGLRINHRHRRNEPTEIGKKMKSCDIVANDAVTIGAADNFLEKLAVVYVNPNNLVVENDLELRDGSSGNDASIYDTDEDSGAAGSSSCQTFKSRGVPVALLDDPNQRVRYRAWLFAIVAWSTAIVNLQFGAYVLFKSPLLDPCLAPVLTYVTSDYQLLAQVLYYPIFIYLTANWIFPPTMMLFLAICIWTEYTALNHDFRAKLRPDGDCTSGAGSGFDGSYLEQIRVRHQKLARLVNKTDKCLCVCYGAQIFGHIGIFTLLLYSILFYPKFVDSPLVIVVVVFWFLASSFELIAAATGAVLVNNAAHKINERIHDLDLQSMDLHAVGQVNVFIKRLHGEQIGFTVFRLFVIDRSATLSILGMLVTYFLLFMQLSPPSAGVTSTISQINTTTTAYTQ